jgi:DNA-binding transcriptional regulator YhcF (GntR family)
MLPPDRVEELKQKYNLTDEGVQDLLGNVQIQEVPKNPSRKMTAPEEDEEEEYGMFGYPGLAALAKKGGGNMGDMMSYALLQDLMERREDRSEDRRLKREERARAMQPQQPSNQSIPEITELRKTVEGLRDAFQRQKEEDEKTRLATSIVETINARMEPQLTALNQKVEALQTRAEAATQTPAEASSDLRTELKDEIEKLGEKIAQQGSSNKVTLDDLDNILEVVDKIEGRFGKKEVEGDVNWKNLAINELGEIGKEFVHTYREIETEKRKSGELETKEEHARRQTPMQQVMKRQVQNYIMQKLQAGKTQLDVRAAARDLGITEAQVIAAYQQLEAEGWFKQTTGGMENGKSEKTQETATEAGTETTTEEQFRRQTGVRAHQDNVFDGRPTQF